MADYKLILPAMGEGVMEATIISWLKNPGDMIEEDDAVVEIATDKDESEVQSPVSSKLKEILLNGEDLAKIGDVTAIIEVDGVVAQDSTETIKESKPEAVPQETISELEKPFPEKTQHDFSSSDKCF